MVDPFADLVDETPQDAAAVRTRLLGDVRRGYVPLRKVLVQRPNTEKKRASVLADLVRARQERPLDALLVLHALEPVLHGSPLPLGTWAKMMHRGPVPCTSNTASNAFDALVTRGLVRREGAGHRLVLTPLLEDGSGKDWTRPGQNQDDIGPGYFTLPYDYWTAGLADKLNLPGKAMLLIALAETTQKPSFTMAIERASEWYGLSERTAERGFKQLADVGVLRQHRQLVADPRSPTGLRAVWHRALDGPYSTDARAQLQKATRRATRQRLSETATTPAAAGKRTRATRRGRAPGSGSVDVKSQPLVS